MKFHQAAFTDILLTHQTPRCTLQYTLRKARALPHTHSANAKQSKFFWWWWNSLHSKIWRCQICLPMIKLNICFMHVWTYINIQTYKCMIQVSRWFLYIMSDICLSFCLPGSKAQYKLDLYAVWYDDAKVFFLTLLCHSAKTSFCN